MIRARRLRRTPIRIDIDIHFHELVAIPAQPGPPAPPSPRCLERGRRRQRPRPRARIPSSWRRSSRWYPSPNRRRCRAAPPRREAQNPSHPRLQAAAATRNWPQCSRWAREQAPMSCRGPPSRRPLQQGYSSPTAHWTSGASAWPATRRGLSPLRPESRPSRPGPQRLPRLRPARRTEAPGVEGSTRWPGARDRTRPMPVRQCRKIAA